MTQQEMFDIYRLHASLYIAAARMETPESLPEGGHDHPEIRQEIAQARRAMPAQPAQPGMVAHALCWIRDKLHLAFRHNRGLLAGQNAWPPEL